MNQYVLKNGLLLGGIMVGYTLILYILGVDYMLNFGLGLLSLVISISVWVYLGVRFRKLNGGYIRLKDAFGVLFLLIAISALMTNIFNVLLYQVIDPDLKAVVSEKLLVKTETMMQNFGTPQEEIDKQLAKMEAESKSQFSIMSQLLGYFWTILIGALFSLIVAAIIKKNPPDSPFDQSTIDSPTP